MQMVSHAWCGAQFVTNSEMEACITLFVLTPANSPPIDVPYSDWILMKKL
jgi:hypothetical protein